MAMQPEDVFSAYNLPGLVVDDDSLWIRFDREFARLLGEKGISRKVLAKQLNVSWQKLNAMTGRSKPPGWMTPTVIRAMHVHGFDINYVLLGKPTPAPLAQDEAKLLDNYRNSSADSQSAIRKIGSALAEQDEELMQRPVRRA